MWHAHMMQAAGEALHQLLGEVNLRITGRALEAMARGDMPGLGWVLPICLCCCLLC